jgi:acetyl-CoA C-acetyltransferase
MSRVAALIGYAAAPVGRYQVRTDDLMLEHELGAKVALEAFATAGVGKRDIDSLVVAHPGDHTKQGYFHTFMAAYLGLPVSGTLVQVLGNGMTGGHAFDQAVTQVISGQAKIAVAFGAHYETGTPTADHLDYSIRLTGDVDFQSIFGAVPISWYAMDAIRYMHEHGIGREKLAAVAVKNRRHASLNSRAQFRKPITVDDVLAQRKIVEPFGLYEVPARSDGAACIVVADEEIARASRRPYVAVRGRGFHHDGIHQLPDHPADALRYRAPEIASRFACRSAGIAAGDIDVAQVYAPLTIVEILAVEALGLVPRGEATSFAESGDLSFDGAMPVNTDGGCLSRGHPPEATPLYDVVELCDQLLGEAGGRQVADAELALTVSELGHFNAALVHILERRG